MGKPVLVGQTCHRTDGGWVKKTGKTSNIIYW